MSILPKLCWAGGWCSSFAAAADDTATACAAVLSRARMIIEKPYWIAGLGSLLQTVDVHPDGTRFVTAGSDSIVRVWSMGTLSRNVRPPAASSKLALLEERAAGGAKKPDSNGSDDEMTSTRHVLRGKTATKRVTMPRGRRRKGGCLIRRKGACWRRCPCTAKR